MIETPGVTIEPTPHVETNGRVFTGPPPVDTGPIECRRDFQAALRVVLPLVPLLAVILTVFLYSATGASGGQYVIQLVLGSVLLTALLWTMVLAAIASAFYYWFRGTAADHANSRAFSELNQRLRGLQARYRVVRAECVKSASEQSAADEALAYIQAARDELSRPGLRWVLGVGYINAWNLIHRAEEALIEIEPWNDAIRGAQADQMKIHGSLIGGASQSKLLENMQRAVDVLEARYRQIPLPVTSAESGDKAPLSEADEQRARATLREARKIVNDFRDDLWDGLVRHRNNLLAAMAVIGTVTFLLLALSLNGHGPMSADAAVLNDPIFAAGILYLVGAIVGLFKRLSDESSSAADVEDYGLTTARLLLTPVLSGLAAIGGAFIVAMVPATIGGEIAKGLPSIGALLALGQNPYGIVFAAIFGLSPSLLITTIGKAADQYKLDIRNSEAAQSAAK